MAGNSRVNKYDKRRKNTKSLTIFTILGSVLLVVFIALLIFDGGNNKDVADQSETNQSASESGGDANGDKQPENNSEGESDNKSSDSDEKKKNEDEVEKQEVEPSDDNVVKAYTGNWEPVGTEQTGSHSINYDEGSKDRIEMSKAVSTATDLNSDSLTMWWIARNGDQKVEVTASNANESKTYRVYLTWIENEGWKPTKVEELKKNDQKYRFE